MASIFPKWADQPLPILCCALLALSGCATTQECDPRRDPGFFGSINCHGSGAYSERQDALKQSVAQAQKEQAAMAAELRGSEETSQGLSLQIVQAQTELDDMDRQVRAMQSSLKQASQGNSTLAAKVNRLQKRIKTLRAESQKAPPKQAELSKLQKELKQAQRESEAYKSLGK
jgi:chromosome segregation ATPase